ncbi:MAG: glycosyltransferase family 4 protein [Kouleothrix sp.]|nr:glycosyltransferase family 4 protein [Kouleothrix sp.]
MTTAREAPNRRRWSKATRARPVESGPLRLLLVTPRYVPHVGGVEHHVHQVARRLARAGVDVTVLTTDPAGQLPPDERSEGVRIIRVPAWPARRDYYVAPGIYRTIVDGGWDLVHVQSYHTLVGPLAMLAALRAKIPYVLTFHGGGSSSRLRNALRGAQLRLLRPLLARAERLVAVARFEVELYGRRLRLPRERFACIPNGSDMASAAQPGPAQDDGTLLASVGRLERYKGHHRILAALPLILAQRPDARLWIAGSGPYEQPLRDLARRLGVEQRVEIRAVPAAERETMARELSRARLVVLLSEFETHPIAVMEALALGRPALVADTSGLSELAERGLARAIPLESTPAQVAAAALDQLRQPLAPPSVELPTWDECAAGLLELYATVMGRLQCAS